MAVTARSQRMGAQTEGAELCLDRAIRHLASHPKRVLMCLGGTVEDPVRLRADSDWVGDVTSPNSCSGDRIQRGWGVFAIGVILRQMSR